jgi:alpha-glucuronidase
MPSYYHRADSIGLGFDRSTTGSGATQQYPDSLARLYNDLQTCPEEYILWFHHVPWDHTMKDGSTLWQSLCRHYQRGVDSTRRMLYLWQSVEPKIDAERFRTVESRLKTQVRDAIWWKDACLLYFQQFSGKRFPEDVEPAVHELEDLEKVQLNISNFECPSKELLNKVR